MIDEETQERCVWFLGTTLDSWTLIVPRYVWQLPWHSAQIEFDCQQDAEGRYTQYKMRTQSAWATSDVHLSQSEHDPWHFEGFPI